MEFRQLVSFAKVAQLGNLSAAAEELGYSQSAVTIQIQKLEEELGTRLFDRIGHRLSITEAGGRFLPYALDVIGGMDRARRAMEPAAELTGTLRIGAVESVMMYHVDRVIKAMRRRHPKVSFRIFPGAPEELAAMLNGDAVDLVYLLETPVTPERWVKAAEGKEEMVFVASPARPVCARKDLAVKDILDEPLILTEKGANYRRAFDEYLSAQNLSIRPLLEVSSTGYILQAVTEMDCVSLLPRYVVAEAIAKKQLVELPVRDFRPEMYSQLFYHRDKWKTREMEEFIRIAAEAAGG